MEKPPIISTPGMNKSTHCPALNVEDFGTFRVYPLTLVDRFFISVIFASVKKNHCPALNVEDFGTFRVYPLTLVDRFFISVIFASVKKNRFTFMYY